MAAARPLVGLVALALATAGSLPLPSFMPSAAGKHIVVIGAGYSGLTAACELRTLGYDVTVLDKLPAPGGRAQRRRHGSGEHAFQHDAGPSWYWMPEVFEEVFQRYGHRREDLYNLTLLDPAYQLVFDDGEALDVPGTAHGFLEMALRLDPGSDVPSFFRDAEGMYDLGVRHAIWEVPSWPLSAWMFDSRVRPSLATRSLGAHIASYASSPRLRTVLEWPSKFLGLEASSAPSLYALLTWAGHAQGTWLPSPDGMAAPALALHRIAAARGVRFQFNMEVTGIDGEDRRRVSRVHTSDGRSFSVDGIVASADYQFVEQRLLPPNLRRHQPSFWEKQVMAPNALVFMLCVAAPVAALSTTHTLFLDVVGMPFYATSDRASSGPRGTTQTSVFVLIPIPEGPEPPREELLDRVLRRLGVGRGDLVCGAEGYGPREYTEEFHAWRGNAFGLANTLAQTHWLKPPMDSLAENLVFAGHLTHPGPGVPPAMVSGILAARLLHGHITPPPTATALLFPALLLALLALATLAANSRLVRNARALYLGGRTYFAAASTMPLPEFNRIAALYAVFRAADDIVDCTRLDAPAREAALAEFTSGVLRSRGSRLGYPPRLWRTFFGAMRADTAPGPMVCRTTAELVAYMDGSAAVLGEFMLPALGAGTSPSLVPPARALGFAFQLTNMLRDVREDARLGRQYIPADACARHGVSDLGTAEPTDPAYRALMEEMFAMADGWYAQAEGGIARLPARTRAPIALAARVYHRLHDAIRGAGYALEPRVTVPWSTKLAFTAAMLPPSKVVRMVGFEGVMRLVCALQDWGPAAAALLAIWLATQLLDVPGELSYAGFHAIWTLPALALAGGLLFVKQQRYGGGTHPVSHPVSHPVAPLWPSLKRVGALTCVAVLYVTPWDSYLISRGVWASTQVAGTLALIPLEEYLFFVLATLITAATRALLWQGWRDVGAPRPSRVGTALLLAAFALGVLCLLASDRTLYIGLVLMWAVPVLLLQWCVGGHVLAAHAGPLARTVLVAGGGLALVDRWAIQRNCWVLNPELTLWQWGSGLHPEEVLFFLLTSAMCCCGLTLLEWADRGLLPALSVAGWKPRLHPMGPTPAAAPASDGAVSALAVLKARARTRKASMAAAASRAGDGVRGAAPWAGTERSTRLPKKSQ